MGARERRRGLRHTAGNQGKDRGTQVKNDGERGRPTVGKGPLRRRRERLLEQPREGGMGREGEREVDGCREEAWAVASAAVGGRGWQRWWWVHLPLDPFH